jgi:hypothetical protein
VHRRLRIKRKVELDEAQDLNAVEDAPTECLSEHEKRNDGSEKTNPSRREVAIAPIHTLLLGQPIHIIALRA